MQEHGDRGADDGEDENQNRYWLWVDRDAIRNLRIGVRAAGISAGEFNDLDFSRETPLILGIFLKVQSDLFAARIQRHQRMAAAFALFLEFKRQNEIFSPMPLQINARFAVHRTIRSLDQNWCWTELRWRREEVFRLAVCVGLSDAVEVRLDNGMKVSGETVLIVGLYSMHWPFTQEHIAYQFGFANQSVVSRVLSKFCNHMLTRFLHLIQSPGDNAFAMWTNYVADFVTRVRNEWPDCPAGMEDIGCFVDGSANYTCRPRQRQEHSVLGTDTQRAWYNSYYGNHGQKFQGVVAPNGMFLQVYGPVSIRVHDSPLVSQSRLNQKLAWLSNTSGKTIKAHGDSAYPKRSHLLKHDSYRMAQKRICVEWSFGKMQQIFAVTDFEAHLQV
jgi:hypothetical protein